MLEQGMDYLFNEVSLYTKEVFNVFELKNDKYEYNKDEFLRFLYYIGVCQNKEYYLYLKAVIDMQLEYIKSEDEKDKQSKDLECILNKIANLVKK